ncbi:MAG: hypothetical protein JWQ57_2038 [Mucilaginibacter sp.]|nr:hypothetical protein [Mucilaginibacter sp.]
MLIIHLHKRYFSTNKCSYNIYCNRFHINNTALYQLSLKQNSTGKIYLPVLSRYFYVLKNTFAFFNKVLKMYYTPYGFIWPTKPMRCAYQPNLFLSAQ